jgi:type I restriction enzyme S subunit
MDFKCDELISEKTDADSRALTVQELQQRSHGSVFSTITRDTFRSIQVPFSGGSLTRSFSSLVSIMFEKVLANNLQNIELIQLRDTLLPKLISGELRLDEITSP